MDSAPAWVCEWQLFSDYIEPRLRGKAARNAVTRKYFSCREEALTEQRLQRLAHAGNINFVSSVTPWSPPSAKQPKGGKASRRRGRPS
jgi:hypothetical protein